MFYRVFSSILKQQGKLARSSMIGIESLGEADCKRESSRNVAIEEMPNLGSFARLNSLRQFPDRGGSLFLYGMGKEERTAGGWIAFVCPFCRLLSSESVHLGPLDERILL